MKKSEKLEDDEGYQDIYDAEAECECEYGSHCDRHDPPCATAALSDAWAALDAQIKAMESET